MKPIPVFYFLTAGHAFLLALALTVAILFQVAEAGLSPLQLVLVGTALEATIFLCEMPTGIIADVYSRRLSVLIGFVITGLGLLLMGAFASFLPILLGSVVWGVGYTFISGARHAWISDEIGVEQAGRVFIRASQFELFARIAAIPIAVGIGSVDLNAPVLIAGGLFIVFALVLVPIMPEDGFKRGRSSASPSASFISIFRAGKTVVFTSPLLLTVFGIALFYGMSSEGFDRLWEAHFLRDIGLPAEPSTLDFGSFGTVSVEAVFWFGALRMVSTFCALGAAEVAHRRVDLNNHSAVSRWLFIINVTQMISLLVLAIAGGFWLGAIALWVAVSLSRVYDPLYLGWINQNIQSNVRATVLSMSSQADSFGQIAGGPAIGVVGSLVSLRAALSATAACLIPALLLYMRAFRLGPQDSPVEQPDGAEATP